MRGAAARRCRRTALILTEDIWAFPDVMATCAQLDLTTPVIAAPSSEPDGHGLTLDDPPLVVELDPIYAATDVPEWARRSLEERHIGRRLSLGGQVGAAIFAWSKRGGGCRA